MPQCECELTQQSEYSPGIVLDSENIAYCLLHPVDISDPISFAIADTLMPRKTLIACELSVCRIEHSTKDVVRVEVVEARLARRPGRTFLGFWLVPCKELRGILDDCERTICVVDDGLQKNPGHAHLGFSQRVVAASKNVQKAKQAAMIEAFMSRNIHSLEDCFAA